METEKNKEIVKTIFLNKFTEEIILSLYKEERKKELIKIEKLKQEFVKPIMTKEQSMARIIRSPVFEQKKDLQPSNYTEKDKIQKKPFVYITKSQTKPIKSYQPSILEKTIPQTQIRESAPIRGISPEYVSRPEDFKLGKIENILSDPSIQSLECPGPGKNILIRRYNKTQVTKLALNQQGIREIINSFSNKAKIPVIGGILKAAVGNYLISAVDSDIAGSRFLLTKINLFS
jgi:hypothetical protein